MTPPEPSPKPPWRKPFWARHATRTSQIILDLAILCGSFVLAYLLRFEFQLDGHARAMLAQIGLVVAIQLLMCWATGIYSFVWRYIGLAELHAFAAAAGGSAVPLLLLRFGLPDALHVLRVPLSVTVMDTILAFGGLLALRVLRRVVWERYERERVPSAVPAPPRKPVLLVGAGRAGVMVAREIRGRAAMDVDIVGFVDDDPAKLGTVIHGVRVLGSTADVPALVARHRVQQVVICIVEASRPDIRRIVEICEATGVRVRIVPGLYEILEGKVAVTRIRDVEIEDLLGREPVELDRELLRRFLGGKRVMVTGAGGSIGSELARLIAGFGAERLLLVERAEGNLFEIDAEVRRARPGAPVVPLVADVGDERRMKAILAAHRPQVLFHAAAHKHVPLMEANPIEAVKNNVLATERLGRLAGLHGVEVFVLVSTDKAIRPASVMGASKRVAEMVVQALGARHPTRYVAVRFGNVLGSTGSVVPIFRRQIAEGGPVTVTHPDATRYFMTIPEAAQLVLEAGAIGGGGDVLMLDMGERLRIVDLAKHMITLSGLRPGEDVEIAFTGLRPGEKVHEELDLEDESLAPTRHPKIGVVRLAPRAPDDVERALRRLELLVAEERPDDLRDLLAELVPESTLVPREPSIAV